jgi:hypothetical protein
MATYINLGFKRFLGYIKNKIFFKLPHNKLMQLDDSL